MNLTALSGLQQLRELTIRGNPAIHYTPAAMSAIKTLPLRSLELLRREDGAGLNDDGIDWSAPWLTPLLTLPHALQKSLQQIELCAGNRLDATHRLVSLSSLIQLRPSFISVAALPDLASFTALRMLILHLHRRNPEEFDPESVDEHGCVRAAGFLPRLVHCKLTALSISQALFGAGAIAQLCRSAMVAAFASVGCSDGSQWSGDLEASAHTQSRSDRSFGAAGQRF